MKKILLALTLAIGTLAYGQNAISIEQNRQMNPELKVSESDIAPARAALKQRNGNQASKVAGGLITNQLIGYSDTIYQLYGGSGVFGIFQVPMYKDSTLQQEFSNGTSWVDRHAVGMVYDPTSFIWGDNKFTNNDAVTIDSVHILGKYSAPSSITNPSGDSLIVEIAWSPISGDATNGVLYSPNAQNPDTCLVETHAVTVNTPGGEWELTGSNRMRTGIELTAADLRGLNDNSATYSIAVNQTIPAGNIAAISFAFKSAYAGTVSQGDTFFSTVDYDNAAIPNFSARLAQESNFSGTRYFCDPDGENATSELLNSTLYQTWGDFRDDIFLPWVSSGYLTYLTITGTSTVGIDEEEGAKAKVELYPNPTTGRLNIAISQGGTYNLEVVNMLGQVVHSEEVSVSGSEELRRDFSNLSKGIYLVNVKGENFSNTTKLTINK